MVRFNSVQLSDSTAIAAGVDPQGFVAFAMMWHGISCGVVATPSLILGSMGWLRLGLRHGNVTVGNCQDAGSVILWVVCS